jgi:hypothetical protein
MSFGPLGDCFYFGQFFENYRTSLIFWASFFHGKCSVLILGWARFWAIFSQAHLVTLI